MLGMCWSKTIDPFLCQDDEGIAMCTLLSPPVLMHSGLILELLSQLTLVCRLSHLLGRDSRDCRDRGCIYKLQRGNHIQVPIIWPLYTVTQHSRCIFTPLTAIWSNMNVILCILFNHIVCNREEKVWMLTDMTIVCYDMYDKDLKMRLSVWTGVNFACDGVTKRYFCQESSLLWLSFCPEVVSTEQKSVSTVAKFASVATLSRQSVDNSSSSYASLCVCIRN